MHDLTIKGVQKTSLIDYPGKICSVVFLNRCNFKCPFCHNPELVFDEKDVEDVDIEEYFDFLADHKKWIDGVCITGGEPTLHLGLIEFMKRIKSLGLLVKLDTNGTNPDIVLKALEEDCVDFVAMDIKSSLASYADTTRSKVNSDNIRKTIQILVEAGKKEIVDYEFRSTIIPKIHTQEEMQGMAQLISGAKRYCIQQFHVQDRLVDETFRQEKTYLLSDLEKFKNLFIPHVTEVYIRE